MTIGIRGLTLIGVLVASGLTISAAQAEPTDTPGLTSVASRYSLSDDYQPGDTYMGIRLLGTLRLAPVEPHDLPMVELSGLAFDEDENILYALSDRGRIYHLRPRFENSLLVDVSVLAVYRLLDSHGQPLKGRKSDSEGMAAVQERNALKGDTELVISFERKHRIWRFNPQGQFLGKVKLPPRLADKHRYRNPNRGLETVAYDPHYGLLTAPEKPFRDSPGDEVEIVALNKSGAYWRYRLAPEPNPALVGMEVLEDGSLVTLERAYGSYFVPFISTIRRVRRLPPGMKNPLSIETVARMSTSQGWNLDNFEGLARHSGNRFFMISDDNGMIYQSTLLSYFEVLEHEPHQRSQPASSLESRQQTP